MLFPNLSTIISLLLAISSSAVLYQSYFEMYLLLLSDRVQLRVNGKEVLNLYGLLIAIKPRNVVHFPEPAYEDVLILVLLNECRLSEWSVA